jgi:hypothetical protein
MTEAVEVCLNRFPVRQLNQSDRTVWIYSCRFKQPPEPEAIYQSTGKILWQVKTPGARLGSTLAVQFALKPEYMQGEGWALQLLGQQELNPEISSERRVLEQIARRDLEQKLRGSKNRKIERNAGKGLIWWNDQRVERAGDGWQVHSGVLLDVVIDVGGLLLLEIDSHYRFYTPWTLQEWIETHPEAPLDYLRNTYDETSWRFIRIGEESPEGLIIPELGISLADYHRQKNATEAEIAHSSVVYVRSSKRGLQNREIAHLSCRLRPSISMEVLSYLVEQNQPDAAKVFNQVRKPINDRLQKGAEVAKWLIQNVYGLQVIDDIKPQSANGFRFKKDALLIQKGTVSRPEAVLQRGCLRAGELKFGCLDLVGTDGWAPLIKQQLLSVAQASGVTLDLTTTKYRQDLPERDLARRQFWAELGQNSVRTILVITKWLGDKEKMRLRCEALQAGIALQFMLPMTNPDKFRAANITLGLLVKAGWQPVGVKMPDHPKVAELTIGFDAGANSNLFYGTSAFAVLANGQSLGWEIPEAQPGERFSGRAIWQAVLSIVARFERLVHRKPRRILLLRDGFVRDDEFELTIQELEEEGIAVDLLEVHKSGAGRMAIALPNGTYRDAPPGVGVSLIQDQSFRLITTQAKAGGSARPLEIVRIHGDAPLALLATEIFRLSQFHPASSFIPSRLPMPLHYADRMIKEVQRLGQVGVLHNVDRQKIFAA